MTQPRTRQRPGGKSTAEQAVLSVVPEEATTTPTGVPHVLTAILQVMRAVHSVSKDSFNEQQRFKFRGIDDVLNAVTGHMRDAAITTTPRVLSKSYEQVNIGTNRTLTGHATVEVCYEFTSLLDGSVKEVIVPGEAMDVGDKAYSKAMSVAWRTALIQTFALATGEPDPDHQTYQRTQDEACRVEPSPNRAERPQERQGSPQPARPPQPTTEQLSRWESQIWEVGSDGLHAVAIEIWNAGGWEAPVPGKEGRRMVQELVDRVACMATSEATPPTREQYREMWSTSGNLQIIDMHVSSGEGQGPTLRAVLEEVGAKLQQRLQEAAAGTANGQALTSKAAESWDGDMRQEALAQEGETPA